MSRSRKDGRHGGGHHEARNTGKEYWSARCLTKPMQSWGRAAKIVMHREERRRGRAEVTAAIGGR